MPPRFRRPRRCVRLRWLHLGNRAAVGPGVVAACAVGRSDADLPRRLHAPRSRPASAFGRPASAGRSPLCRRYGAKRSCRAAARRPTAFGLTTQIPVRAVYLTSGPGRRLHFGALTVELRHAPRWQLAAPHRKAGDVIRALAWLGPEEVEDSLEAVLPTLSEEDRDELAIARAVMPIWMAEPVSARLSHG